MKRVFVATWHWLDDRLGIADLIGPAAKHLVPQRRAVVVRLRQRDHDRVHRPGCDRCRARLLLRPFVFASVRNAAVHHQRRALRELPARPALLRRLGHGADGRRAHGADFSLRLLQIPARDELDDRRAAARLHAGHGIYRAAFALGSKRDLVGSGRGGTGGTRSVRSATGSRDSSSAEQRLAAPR